MAMITSPARESQANVEIAFARGWSAFRINDFEAAAQAFGQAASARDDNALSEDASFWRGVALDRANHLTEAQAALTQFLVRYPTSDRAGEASVMLGWLLMRAGEVTAAEARFGSALGTICHSTGNDLNLQAGTSWAALVNQPAPSSEACGGILVVPGDANASYLYQKLTSPAPCSGSQMPRTDLFPDPLPACVTALVASWIAEGAVAPATDGGAAR